MFRSLRFRLPAVFLAGLVLAGLVATAIAVGLFRESTREDSTQELHRVAAGLAAVYADEASLQAFGRGQFESATAYRVYWIPRVPGLSLFPGERRNFLPDLPPKAVDARKLREGRTGSFAFKARPDGPTLLAAAEPVLVGGENFGSLVVAKPENELDEELATLVERLALAFLVGIVVAGGLGLYLSRRITRPVLELSRAADEVAEGRYGVQLPRVGGGDEIGQLAERFGQMASRLGEAEQRERNFLITVSHELRTPLTAIRGHVAALREGVVSEPEQRDASLQVIATETDRLGRLVGDVLDLAKLDAHRFTVRREEVEMERLLEQAYAAFGEEARRRGIEYRREVSARPVIVSDGDRVLQVISNLLSNAFRWTPDGGRIELALAAENGSISVDVGDSGPGIAPEERERVFRPFWSGDKAGTGLGLTIARELAHALGGSIELESTVGRGSHFRLVLPATAV